MENLANTGLGDNLSSGSLLIQQIIYMIRWKNLYLSQLLKLNSSFLPLHTNNSLNHVGF